MRILPTIIVAVIVFCTFPYEDSEHNGILHSVAFSQEAAPAPPAQPAPAPAAQPAPAPAAQPAPAPAAQPAPAPAAQPAPAPAAKAEEKKEQDETVPQVHLDPKKGFGQIFHPNVQDRLSLTEAQRQRVQQLSVELTQALAATKVEDLEAQQKVIAESDKKIEAVLTPEQLRLWPKVFEQRFIRVNFNGQSWEQALRWFASRVGKELSMEAPPPGTITYNSPGEITPNEALDKINSRLFHRGYTLVNSENSLILFNLRDMRTAPSLAYLPKVSEQTLGDYGNFEFVALTLPLEYRDATIVKAQMKPFQSNYCRVVDLPGNSLMLVDAVYHLKAMVAVAKAVANPQPPAKPVPPPPPPESIWDSYVIDDKNDVDNVQEILTKFANVNGFKEGNTLYYNVPEAQHANIRKLIELLEKGSTERPKSILEVYSMEGLTDTSPTTLYRKAVMRAYGYVTDPSVGFGTAVVDLIKKIAPDADVAPNQVSNKLAVFAVPEDHEKIKDLFDKLQGAPSPEFKPVVKIYSFKDPTRSHRITEEVSDMIKKLVPGIQYHSYDPRKSQLLVIGLEREHEVIAQALKEFEVQSLPDEDRVLGTYPLTATQMVLFGRLFEQVRRMPELRDVLELRDNRQNHITIWATPTQQEKVKSIIDEITKSEVAPAYRQQVQPGEGEKPAATGPGSELTNYAVVPMRNVYYYAAQQIIVNTVPGITVSVDHRANALVLYSSSPELVEQAKKIIEQMDEAVGTDIRFFPFVKEPSPDVLRSLVLVAPRTRTIWDKKNARLLVYGPKDEVAKIAEVIEALKKTETDTPDTFRTISVLRDIPNELLDFVRQSFPRAQINFNRDSKQITVTAPDSQHVAIAKMLIEAEQTLPPEEQTVFHTLDKPITDHLITLIRETVKSVGSIGEIKRDNQNPKLLIVRARPNVLEKVKEVLDNRETLLPSVELNELHSFSVAQETRKRFDAVRDEFVRQNGDFRVLHEDRKDILSVWATPTQIKQLEEFLAQLSKERSAELAEKQIFHSLKHVDLTFVKSMFDEIYPGTKIMEDKTGGRIILRVRPEYYEGAKELLAKLDSRDPDQQRRYPKPYAVDGLYSYDAQGRYYAPIHTVREIEQFVPQAKVRFDYYTSQIVVWGTDEEQKIVSEMLDTIRKDDDKTKGFERYPLRRAQPYVIIGMINRLYPHLIVRMDSATNSIIVEAGKTQLQTIQKLLDKIDPAEPGPTDPVIRFYQLKSKPDTTLITSLQRLVPTAQIVPDPDAKQLMIICKPDEHRILERNIQSILETFTQPEEPMLFIYPVNGEQRKQIQEFITAAKSELKDITILPETRADQMFIWARPTEHDIISGVLQQIKTSTEREFEIKIRPFQLVFLDPQIAQDIISEYHAEVKVIFDAKLNRLLVCGTDQNLDKVAETLKLVDKTQIDGTQPQFETFTIDGVRFESIYMRSYLISHLTGILQQVAPNAKFFPGSDYYRIIAWGTPDELTKIRATMEKIGYSTDPKDQPQVRVFDPKAVDPKIVDSILKPMVPDAFINVDETTGKIVVFAREKDMSNISATLEHLERSNVDERVSNKYDITGTKSEIVLEAIRNVYPSLKITEDTANNRLIIWATPEEHVRIGELVEQVNQEPSGEMSEKFVPYPITRLNYTTVINLIKEMFPEAKTFGDLTSEKITVKARGKEHKEIKELLESLQEKDDKFRTKLTVYQIGMCDPVTIEVLLQSLLRHGRSYSAQEIKDGVRGISAQRYGGRDFDMFEYMEFSNPTTRYQIANQFQREGRSYYRVDAKSCVAIVVANEEDQKRIEEAIKSIVSMSDSEQKPVAQRFTLNEIYPIAILDTLKQVAPAVQIFPMFNSTTRVFGGNPNDFVAFGPEPELKKIEKFVEEINASGPSGNRREMLVITIPPGTKFSRQRIIQMLTYLYPPRDAASRPTLGPEPNQIVMLSPKHLHEQIQELINNVCKPLPEGEQTEYKSYPLSHIEWRDAVRYLQEICPNATIRQDTAPKIDAYTGRPLPIRTLVVLATPVEHAEIAKALSVLDQEHPQLHEPFSKTYTIHKKSAATFFRILRQIVPKAQFMAGENAQDVVAYASSEEHEKIKKFVDDLNGEGDTGGTMQFNVINIPQGTAYDRTHLVAWLRGVFPQLYPYPGSEPHQILVFGYEYQRAKAQELIDKACAPVPEDQRAESKLYPLKNIRDFDAVVWLKQVCPNAIISTDRRVDPINGIGILVRATPLEHALIEKTLAELDVDVPKNMRPIPKHYMLEDITPGTYYPLYTALYYAFSTEIVSMIPSDPAKSVFLIFAREEVHKKIDDFLKKHVEELNARKNQLQVYQLTNTNFRTVYPILLQLITPGITQITQGNAPDVLYVYGSPKDQKVVAETIQKIEAAALKRTEMDKEGLVQSLKFYRIASRDAYQLYAMLQAQFPATIVYPTSYETIIAWATPKEHEEIAKIVGAVAEAFPEQEYRTYFFKHVPITYAHVMLSQLFPTTQAMFTIQPATGDLIVLATPENQERVRKCIEHIDVERPKEMEQYAVAYDLTEFPVSLIWGYIYPNFLRAVPTCTILPTTVSTQLVVFCRESEHKKIAQIIEEMMKTNPLTKLALKPYTIKTTTAGSAYPLLVGMFPYPNVQFGFSPLDKHVIFARANAKDHERIQNAIDAMNQTDPDRSIPKSYRFQRASIYVVAQAVRTVFPTVEIAYDPYAEMLLITATPEQHTRIEAMVKEYDALDPETQTTMKIHNTGNVNIANLNAAISVLYGRNPRFRAVPDLYNRTLTVLATPEQQKFIADLIQQIQEGGLADSRLTLKVFPVQNRNIFAIQSLIRNMFTQRGVSIDLTPDYSSNSLVAYARPEELELMQQIMDATKQPDKVVEMYQLQKVDPYTIGLAVREIFAEESYYLQPRINVDDQTNTLFVRGTLEQVDRIRELLIRMGETQLLRMSRQINSTSGAALPAGFDPVDTNAASTTTESTGLSGENTGVLSGQSGAVRTISIGDVKDDKLDAALKKLEEEVKSKGKKLIIREMPQPMIQEKEPENKNNETKKDDAVEEEPVSEDEKSVRYFNEEKNAIALFQVPPLNTETETTPEVKTEEKPAETPENSEENETEEETAQKIVFVIKNPDGTLTLMSTDTQELNEVESELKRLTEDPKKSRIFATGRDYTIFIIHEVNARVVLQRLNVLLHDRIILPGQAQQQYGRYGMYNRYSTMGTQRRRTLQLTPETTMNAIVARGTKIDRELVGQLIEQLDKPVLEQESLPIKPENVYIKNLQASELLQQVLAVYGPQIQRTQLPSGAIPRIALNRTNNSIDIYAPESLTKQIKEYAEELDRDAPLKQAEKIHVIRPGKTNSSTVNQAIQAIQQSSMQRYRLSNPNIYNPYMYQYRGY